MKALANRRQIPRRKGVADKPVYRIPTMGEIAEVEPCGLTVGSTFAGCGGSSLGYRMAGYRVLWASEFEPHAAATYKANASPWTVVDTRDLRTLSPKDVMTECGGIGPGELDVLDGSPPCQSFSTSGKREKGWGRVTEHADGTTQRSDDLFFEYARILRGVRPRAFVAENVSGLVAGKAKGYFKWILAELKDCGYDVRAKLLDASWLGVPQARIRIYFVGIRDDLGVRPSFPSPLPYRYVLRDAVPWVESVTYDPRGKFNVANYRRDDPLPTITTVNRHHLGVRARPLPPPEDTEIDDTLRGKWKTLSEGEQHEVYFNLIRCGWDKPAPTIAAMWGRTHGVHQALHPTEARRFSIPELKRIMGFPDDFQIEGPFGDQWARLGNAVPPPMARSVAEVLRDALP